MRRGGFGRRFRVPFLVFSWPKTVRAGSLLRIFLINNFGIGLAALVAGMPLLFTYCFHGLLSWRSVPVLACPTMHSRLA